MTKKYSVFIENANEIEDSRIFLKTTEKDIDNKSEIMLKIEFIKSRLDLT